MGKEWKQWLTLFFWAPKSLHMVTAAMKLKDAYSLVKPSPRAHVGKRTSRVTLQLASLPLITV